MFSGRDCQAVFLLRYLSLHNLMDKSQVDTHCFLLSGGTRLGSRVDKFAQGPRRFLEEKNSLYLNATLFESLEMVLN